MWGIVGGSMCKVEILKPLGLVSWSGSSNKKTGHMTYIIYSITKNNNFEYEIDDNKIHNIKRIYKNYLRKHKLDKLDKKISRNEKI